MKALALLALIVGCTDHLPPITGTQSLKIDVKTPTDLGAIDRRLPDTARTVSLDITALDANGAVDATYNKALQVYTHFLGTLTPYFGGMPLATVQMTSGKGSLANLMLPTVYGPTTLWLDDGADTGATYATGVSPTLWYRDPFISDIQRPASETALDALENAPLDNKNLDVRISRYGTRGMLVITSVYTQGYTVADVQCADTKGTPPCTSGDYDYMDVFSFSAPLDQDTRFLSEGQVIDGFAGGVSEFDGLTEIGFPQTFVSSDTPSIDKRREPAVVKMDPTWFTTNKIMFERNESGAIEIDNAKVCPIDADYTTFKEWKIDPAGVADMATCSGQNVIKLVSTSVSTVDPSTLVGKIIPKVVGIVRPINIGSFNVWLVYPRSQADFTLM